MDYSTLSVERARCGIAIVRMNRPERLNAMTFKMFDEFVELQRQIDTDESVRVLILTGQGRGFCAGLDLDEAQTLPSMATGTMLAGQTSWANSVAGFHRMTKPVIAAVNGPAAGAGMGVALAADIRIASTNARFNAAFVRVGLSGGDVGTSYFLPKLVGLGRAQEILLTGRFVDADEALRIGLVTEITEPGDLLERALSTAELIVENSPFGMTLTKEAIRVNAANSLEAALELENRNQVLATRTADMVEALAAFRGKRTPVYVGQ